ncbi:MAG: hypothetical protein M1827_004903 [Pycnora praestabilis]|nr:MAG: hypothetical protein M1827_004903 [Pycnora praestabilis]
MKQRFSSLDVKVVAHELSNSLCTLRLANVYDLSSVSTASLPPIAGNYILTLSIQRIFLLKFAKPDNRQQLIIDSGFRCHLTGFARATAAAPSSFVTRLRKFLRTRRVTSVSQVGTDRIIEIQFSDGQYRLFLEFYAGGNVVLTDKELNILALLRIVAEGPDQEELRVGLKYSLSNRQNYEGVPQLTKDRLKEGLQKAVSKQPDDALGPSKRSKKNANDALRKALATSITEYPPMLVEHSLRINGFDSSLRPEEVLEDDSLLERLMLVYQEAERVVRDITSFDVSKGYIIAKPNKPSHSPKKSSSQNDGEKSEEPTNLLYDDFHPFRPQQFEDDVTAKILEFEGFNRTVDEFFSSIEAQKLESRLQDREDNAKRKLEAARQDHEKRLGGLQQVQELNVRKAEAIEANLQKVEEATAAVNGLIAQGMDWVEIARLVEMEQGRHNPVAEMIKLPLKLYENTATFLLGEMNFGDDDDYNGDETDSDVSESDDEDSTQSKAKPMVATEKRLAVDIDLALSPWSNARQYYDQKKTAAVKEQKTLQSSSKALRSTEKKIGADLKKGLKQEKQVLRPVRKQLWFEKFIYFISSDGYLIIGGRDAQQNELLYKKYLKKGDVYVHADLHGAASVIIKNSSSSPDAPIPPSTLSQAGNLSVATSSAWDSKAAPTGEYLTTGGFTIRGKKNFLPPAQLLLGFAVMFQISDESKARHVKHRLRDEENIADGANNESTTSMVEKVEEVQNQTHSDASGTDSDDEEFPDARLEYDSQNDEDQGPDPERVNPLQGNSHGLQEEELHEYDEHSQDGAQGSSEDSGEEEFQDGLDGVLRGEADETQQMDASIRHLSAKERRLLRKGQTPFSNSVPDLDTSATDTEEGLGEESKGSAQANTSNLSPSQLATTKQAPQVRGKRGKQKKLASKYADQDEEDRALAMKLLGSEAAKEKADEDAKAKKAREDEMAFQKQRRREQHQRTTREGKEQEELRRLMHEENIETLDEEEGKEMTPLDSFVGTPLPGDEILEAIPVCAPWSALGKYKYKAKLQPGSQKKGKAVKEILHKWTSDGADKKKVDDQSEDTEKIWPRELELVKQWKDTEIINTVPVGKVRVMISGSAAGASGKGGQVKGKARGGKGSKKQR